MSPMHAEHSDACTADRGSSVNNIRIELGGTTLAIVISLVVVIGGCALIMGLNLAKQAEQDSQFRDLQTQYKLVERRYMDMEAYAIVNGWKIPGDDSFGPTGNLQRMKPKEK